MIRGAFLPLAYVGMSLPQIPAAMTRSRPASAGISGSGMSRSSIVFGAVWTAARDEVWGMAVSFVS